MVFLSIYTLVLTLYIVLTLTCSPPSLFCSTHCRCVSVQLIAVAAHSPRCHASPSLVYALFCFAFALRNQALLSLCHSLLLYALPLQFFSTQNYAVATPCLAVPCLAVPCHALAILRYSTLSPIIAIPCHRNSTLFYADAILLISLPLPNLSEPCHALAIRTMLILCVYFAFLFSSLFALPLHLLPSCCFTMPMLR